MSDERWGFADSRLTEALDVEKLPAGTTHRLQIELAQDGLGCPIRVPVMVTRGRKSGPTFGLTAALHGNELNGIPVIHRLMADLDARKLRGSVVAVLVANVPAYNEHTRYFVDGTDLNHRFPGDPNGNVSSVYAYRLIERIVSRFDFLIDLHTASFGRINSLYVRADMTDPRTAKMAYLQRSQIVVNNPPSDRTLRGAAASTGIPAITLEIGNPHRFQERFIKRSLAGLRATLGSAGLLPRRPLAMREPPVICEGSSWMYTDHGGLLTVHPELTDDVGKGEIVARLSNIFGDVVREYQAPEDGIVIGKSVNPVGQTGARILHLGRRSEDESAYLPAAELAELTDSHE